MSHVVINGEGCKACMLCSEFCPQGLLAAGEELNSRGFHPVVQTCSSGCTGCRVCALMCPDCCIEVYREVKPLKEKAVR